ncbi:MAG: hypothetical protein AAGJ35_06790, partial [Myxococcota bacterium]
MNLVQCSPELVKSAVNLNINNTTNLRNWNSTNLGKLVGALIDGPRSSSGRQIAASRGEFRYTWNRRTRYIHYFCEDNGYFNAGPNGNTSCPQGSRVIFFDSTKTETQIRRESCQQSQNCEETLERWKKDSNQPDFRSDLSYVCTNPQQSVCDSGSDRRTGKLFFQPSSGNTFVTSLKPVDIGVAEAFRYRVKFRSRSGKNIGFVPEICTPHAQGVTPYCYTPTVIEALEERVNCLQAIYTDPRINPKLSGSIRGKLLAFLKTNFSFQPSGSSITYYGFEHMNAELRIMMGDEAYIQSLTSRYDLAATRAVAFDGTAFEAGGVKLSGTLGVMMDGLYRSVQYYQSVLDRFFAQSPSFATSFASNTSFIDVNVLTTYFKKVIQASSRKARSWSRIAKEYHNLNRPDLAKRVVERAYATTYMEFVIFSRLMRILLKNASQSEKDQSRAEIKSATLTYKVAMSDMEKVYKEVNQEVNFFGFPPGYVPFPAMDRFSATTQGTNAFAVSLRFAKEKLAIANGKEQTALQTKRQFDTDNQRFQSELQSIENNYENQLVELCGTVTDNGGQTRPAVPKYATFFKGAQKVDNPCGQTGSGQLYNAYQQLEKFKIRVESTQQNYRNVIEQINQEARRIQNYCQKKFELS